METILILQDKNARLESQIALLHDTIARLKSVLSRPAVLSVDLP